MLFRSRPFAIWVEVLVYHCRKGAEEYLETEEMLKTNSSEMKDSYRENGGI